MSQADDEGTPPKFNIHTLNQLAVRLVDHAESIENITAHEMECDLRLAAAACERLAHLRFAAGRDRRRMQGQGRRGGTAQGASRERGVMVARTQTYRDLTVSFHRDGEPSSAGDQLIVSDESL